LPPALTWPAVAWQTTTRDDDRLIERMIAELTATFADVMGNDPSGSGGGAA
jgi:hypothetical protein